MRFSLDRMNMLPVVEGAEAAMAVIDRLQHYRPEARVLGAAAVMALLAERFGLTPQDIMYATSNLMNYAEGRRPEFAAIAEYLSREL